MRTPLKYLFPIAIAAVFSVLLIAKPASAAKLFLEFSEQRQEVGEGENIHLDLFFDSREEDVNAIQGKIFFSSDTVSLERISQKDSILSYWIESPQKKDAGEIFFSGVVPGGFNESKGLILSLDFLAQKEGSAHFNMGNVRVLLNDGKGTELETISSGIDLTIISEKTAHSDDDQKSAAVILEDNTAPEFFTPVISKDKDLFDNKWFISFYAKDADYGISHYEIFESENSIDLEKIGEQNIKWAETKNLYLLQDQDLQSYVYVKAIDEAGNEKIVEVLPKKLKNFLQFTSVRNSVIIITILLIAFVLIYRYCLKINRLK